MEDKYSAISRSSGEGLLPSIRGLKLSPAGKSHNTSRVFPTHPQHHFVLFPLPHPTTDTWSHTGKMPYYNATKVPPCPGMLFRLGAS
jgi:hypothetical protein